MPKISTCFLPSWRLAFLAFGVWRLEVLRLEVSRLRLRLVRLRSRSRFGDTKLKTLVTLHIRAVGPLLSLPGSSGNTNKK